MMKEGRDTLSILFFRIVTSRPGTVGAVATWTLPVFLCEMVRRYAHLGPVVSAMIEGSSMAAIMSKAGWDAVKARCLSTLTSPGTGPATPGPPGTMSTLLVGQASTHAHGYKHSLANSSPTVAGSLSPPPSSLVQSTAGAPLQLHTAAKQSHQPPTSPLPCRIALLASRHAGPTQRAVHARVAMSPGARQVTAAAASTARPPPSQVHALPCGDWTHVPWPPSTPTARAAVVKAAHTTSLPPRHLASRSPLPEPPPSSQPPHRATVTLQQLPLASRPPSLSPALSADQALIQAAAGTVATTVRRPPICRTVEQALQASAVALVVGVMQQGYDPDQIPPQLRAREAWALATVVRAPKRDVMSYWKVFDKAVCKALQRKNAMAAGER